MVADPQTLSNLFTRETLGAPENAVGFVLWRVLHRYIRAVDQALAPLALTHLQFTILALAAWMARSGMPVTQTALARFGDIHPMQVSQVVKVLDAKGLIVRLRVATDLRSKRIALTDTGVAALRAAMPVAIAVQEDMFGVAGTVGGPLLLALRQVDDDTPP